MNDVIIFIIYTLSAVRWAVNGNQKGREREIKVSLWVYAILSSETWLVKVDCLFNLAEMAALNRCRLPTDENIAECENLFTKFIQHHC